MATAHRFVTGSRAALGATEFALVLVAGTGLHLAGTHFCFEVVVPAVPDKRDGCFLEGERAGWSAGAGEPRGRANFTLVASGERIRLRNVSEGTRAVLVPAQEELLLPACEGAEAGELHAGDSSFFEVPANGLKGDCTPVAEDPCNLDLTVDDLAVEDGVTGTLGDARAGD